MKKKINSSWAVLGCGINGCGIFFAPLLIVFLSSLVFGASEVSNSYTVFFLISAIFIFPSFIALMVSTIVKVRRDHKQIRDVGTSSFVFLCDSIRRHSGILTLRGWGALWGGLIFVNCSMYFRWASLGTTATFLLLLLYFILGISALVSAFMVRSFSHKISRNRAGIDREVIPAVVLSGEVAEERFVLRRLPVPPGFILLIEDKNLPELETESRYAAGASAEKGIITLRGAFRKTPRGLYDLGPAKIWYQDALGLTKVSVSSAASATLKCLPRFKTVKIVETPRSSMDSPDILCVPHRYPTEDYFRFKEYMPGDDTRRIHWRLSVKTGHLQVRIPETKERTTESVLLVLDSYLPNRSTFPNAIGIESILDNLVEVWISLAARLHDVGNKVSLASVANDGTGRFVPELMHCATTSQSQWQDLGARIAWQGVSDVDDLAATLENDTHLVVVSSRFAPPPPTPPGKSITWVYLPPIDVLQTENLSFFQTLLGKERGLWKRVLNRIFRLSYPTGSEENTTFNQLRLLNHEWQLYQMRKRLRYLAKKFGDETYANIMDVSNSVYRLEEDRGSYRLIGVKSEGVSI